MFNAHVPLSAALVTALLAGCVSVPNQALLRAAEYRSAQSCVRLASQEEPGDDGRLGPAAPPGTVPPALQGFTPRALRTALDIGVLPSVLEFAALPGAATAATEGQRLRALQLRQRLSDRVLLAHLDVQGVLAELECESDRGNRLQFVLTERQGRRDQRLALSGLIVGALTTVVSGGLAIGRPESNAADVVGIVGGGTEAGIGAAGLAEGAGIELRTGRNVLAELWEGPAQSRLLPPTVWRLLSAPAAEAAAGRGASIREEVVARWRLDAGLDDPAAPDAQRRAALLFGAGGRYSLEDLQRRELMLNALQARVWSMSMDLERLLREIIRHWEDTARIAPSS